MTVRRDKAYEGRNLWEACPFTRAFRDTEERRAIENVCLGLTAGAHRYSALDALIMVLVRSKVAVIGGTPQHADAMQAWASKHLDDALAQLPPSWRPADLEAAA